VGKYSLIGASAQLSGTIRLTYSLTAIILEATGLLILNAVEYVVRMYFL
jgi:H+/Cl- antiporter ClcA